jgi:hypothetical protein
VRRAPLDRIVSEVWRDLAPDFGPLWDVRIDFLCSDWDDAFELRGSRYLATGPRWSWHAVEPLPGRLVATASSAGSGALIAVLVEAMERLAAALRAWMPPTWRKYGRPARRLPTWSRLRTRPS